MPVRLDLPPGLGQRPLALPDAAAVAAVMAAGELADTGEVVIEAADIVADWSRPSFDVGASTVGVIGQADRSLVAYAEVTSGDRASLAVHPDYRGRGLEAELARWLRERAGEAGSAVVGLPVPEGSLLDGQLAALGWEVRWASWVLALPADAEIPPRTPPAGYAVRAARPDEHEDCWQVIEDAFLEWSVRERRPFADWSAAVTGRPGFEPWQLRVATDPAGAVVAACVLVMATPDGVPEGYVDMVATRRDHRHRGLAQALLADAFAVARAHGAARSTLSTDSRTGALGLYRRLGMEVISTWVNRCAPTLRAAGG
ncbi:GNAT family N-acetyltransferase [Xylanimonas sp. McL0601]|uniref:GNAT family N-acetyltransferase n=1 Tax=Xylanimonas sp. McL0601 TaxID=3414739 RepID=UPI003CF001FE